MTFINLISLFLLYYLKKSAKPEDFTEQIKKYLNYGMILSVVLIALTNTGAPPVYLYQFFSFLLVGGIIYLIVNTPSLEQHKNLAIAPLPIIAVSMLRFLVKLYDVEFYNSIETYIDAAGIFAFIWAVTMGFNHRKEIKERNLEKLIAKEKERQLHLAQERKNELEKLVQERTSEITKQKEELQQALDHLRSTQEQLVQQEKLASLGQLTAGIAHEIKNPLNFINNFSELSSDFITEMEEELEKIPNSSEKENILDLLGDVKSNLGKIRQHGSRADNIVKSMLMHSRGEKGEIKPTDLNPIIQEYSNLAFHGMRANKNPINVDIQLDLEESLPLVNLNAEDFSRVILNLAKNAFDAMRDKINAQGGDYKAKLIFRTKALKNKVLLEVEDNGPGVPDEIKDKLLMPFFTTKKGTEGTGLGLSITHDIIKSHGSSLEIESEVGTFTRFKILLPLTKT